MIDGVSNMFMAAVGNAKALVGMSDVTSPSGVISEAGDAMAEGSASMDADIKGEGAKLAAIMGQESGPIVKCVCLRAGGETEELTIDMAPKQQAIFGALGGAPTFLGQYETIGVFIAVRADDASLAGAPVSAHVLPVPFADAEVRGDVLLFRVTDDSDAEPVDFTVAEYEAFKAQAPDDWQKEMQERAAYAAKASLEEEEDDDEEEEEDDDEDDDDEDDEDDDEDEQYNSDDAAEDEAENDDENALKELMLAKLLDQFETRSGRPPTDEEQANIEAALDARLGGGDEDSGLTAEEEQQAENIVLAKVCEAFAAQHGREPTADEIKDILSRLRDADAAGTANEEGEEEEDDDEEEEEEEKEDEEQAATDAGGAAASAGAADDAGDDDDGEDGGVDGIIEELTAMYEKEHGEPPTEEVVKSWIATIQEANLDAGAVAGAAAAADEGDARPAKRARSDSVA